MDVIDILKNKKGFIAALDQSGGSSKKTLINYGVKESDITTEEVMFNYIHSMRSRVISNKYFDERIIGVILFEHTMKNDIEGLNTVKYLEQKGIPAFLKIDVGLEDESDGVRLLKDIPNLDERLEEAKKYGIIGTKERSVILEYNEYGIKTVKYQNKDGKNIEINGNGKREIALDYEISKDGNYEFSMINNNGYTVTKTLNVNDDFRKTYSNLNITNIKSYEADSFHATKNNGI